MALTAGLTKVCESRSGGLVSLWLANKHDVSSFTLTGSLYSAVTMVSGKVFYKFEFEQDSGQIKEDGTINESGAGSIAHTIEFYIAKLSQANRDGLQQIFDSTPCGLIGIALDANGTKWVLGYNEKFLSERTLRLRTLAVDGGKAFTTSSPS